MVLKINGDIIGNDWKEIYDWFGFEATCPRDVENAIAEMQKGDRLQVKINSGGGEVFAGTEIYNILRGRDDVDIEIESIAASAASVIAMAGHSTISPAGMLMIHDASTQASGNHQDLSKMADTLKRIDEALANAYVEKTGKSREEIIKLMDRETWLTADKAVELGFVDSISNKPVAAVTNGMGLKVTEEMVHQYKAEKAKRTQREKEKNELLRDLDRFGTQ